MTSVRGALRISAALALAASLGAEDAGAGGFLRRFGEDQKTIWTAPLRASRRHWLVAGLPLAAGSAALIATDRRVVRELQPGPAIRRWSGRVSQFGAVYTLAGGSAMAALAGHLTGREAVAAGGGDALRALANSLVLGYGIKFATARERPVENSGEGRFWKGSDSFPSGHAITSWAVAAAVARQHRCPKWLKVGVYTVAAAVSLSRTGDLRHFPGDVYAGSFLGYLVGRQTARRR